MVIFWIQPWRWPRLHGPSGTQPVEPMVRWVEDAVPLAPWALYFPLGPGPFIWGHPTLPVLYDYSLSVVPVLGGGTAEPQLHQPRLKAPQSE